MDAFHLTVLLDLSDETCQHEADVLRVVEIIGKWPTVEKAVSSVFHLPKTGESDRPIALLAEHIRW